MNQPLPVDLRIATRPDKANAGLWYDKFFNQWSEGFASVPENGKAAWTKEAASDACGEKEQLTDMAQRREAWAEAVGGRLLYFKTDSRFMSGLGREHPVENGFAWHHTLGAPYLPGSSVKGLLRAWARELSIDSDDIMRIFGPQGQKRASVGSVIIGDALPPEPVQLTTEVTTPHYGPYYQDEQAKTPPADWHNPVPIHFLAVKTGEIFVFALTPRRSDYAEDIADCEKLVSWLDDALAWLGAGAKTSVGYGRCVRLRRMEEEVAERQRTRREQRERDAKFAERTANLSPLAQELERAIAEGGWEQNKNAFMQPPLIEDWLERLEANPDLDAIKRLRELVAHHFPGLLENPNKISGKKGNKPVFKERQRGFAERLNTLGGKNLGRE